jgi:hypothetical protein
MSHPGIRRHLPGQAPGFHQASYEYHRDLWAATGDEVELARMLAEVSPSVPGPATARPGQLAPPARGGLPFVVRAAPLFVWALAMLTLFLAARL